MTSEEKQKAIDALKISAPAIAVKHEEFNDYIQTLNKIMDWLEQEPTTKNDLVTLTFSKGTLKYSCKDYVVYKKDWLRSHYGAEIDIMFGDSQYKESTTKNDLPHCQHTDEEIAKSFIEDVEAVKDQLPTTKNDLGVDCISRESIKQKLQEHHDFFVNAYGGFSNLPQNDKSRVDEIINCIAMVVNEPSVTPQEPRKGHWIDVDGIWFKCSECDAHRKMMPAYKEYYCPNCGAKMVEPQESEGSR